MAATKIILCSACAYKGKKMIAGRTLHVCRRRAPQAALGSQAPQSAGQALALWPEVHEDDGCGDGFES